MAEQASIVFLTIPGLRRSDLSRMPWLAGVESAGCSAPLAHSFPAVTWPAQTHVLTGQLPDRHGVIANGFYWREEHRVEMWTAPNSVIQSPQIWDVLKQRNPQRVTGAWFPMLAKECGADVVCMPAPIHRPDGGEDLWCYTRPQEFYGELLQEFGHFPLQHFWGPMANIKSTEWIASSAAFAFKRFQPDFFYIYLPHLDYAAQKFGPSSDQAHDAATELDNVLRAMAYEFGLRGRPIDWWVASEYVIDPVEHVSYPNRILRDAGLLRVKTTGQGELLDFENSDAWALVDHQFSHVFVRDRDAAIVARIVELFGDQPGIDLALAGSDRSRLHLDHPRSGDVVLVSSPGSWQAYYWWMDDDKAPAFARTVDIHRKPGYDPVELFWDPETRSTPLDATLVRGSHGLTPAGGHPEAMLIRSQPDSIGADKVADTEIFDMLIREFDRD